MMAEWLTPSVLLKWFQYGNCTLLG